VQGAHGEVGLGGLDQHGEFDLRGGDGEDVDLVFGQRLEGPGGDAGVAAHADADDRHLGDVGRPVEPLEADLALGLVEGDAGPLVVGGRHGEGQIGGGAVGGDVLHDHVDVDAGVGERPENGGGNAGLVLGEGDAGDDLLFHDFTLVANERAGGRLPRVDVLRLLEAGAHEDRHVV